MTNDAQRPLTPGRLRLSRAPAVQPSEPRDLPTALDSRDEPVPLPDNNANAQDPLLFTADQAAQLLQVRASWLRRRATARAIPCRFLGKHLRFAREDIDQIAHESKQDVRTGPRTTRSGKPSQAA
ncbi:excisionase family DNA binding protein [Lentzea atacamensis]|uniref:Excisionase family DNA binding protein n=1 Tax=Lentzea atacamensis TaxID=531938 RepID=A0A316HZY6_9PSEU|nr:helix-turn-helix domain-containing protein [Lentzea atacamensis]PWK80642.1 excisionase family DNA binding protein [Lentzea atacamensis]